MHPFLNKKDILPKSNMGASISMVSKLSSDEMLSNSFSVYESENSENSENSYESKFPEKPDKSKFPEKSDDSKISMLKTNTNRKRKRKQNSDSESKSESESDSADITSTTSTLNEVENQEKEKKFKLRFGNIIINIDSVSIHFDEKIGNDLKHNVNVTQTQDTHPGSDMESTELLSNLKKRKLDTIDPQEIDLKTGRIDGNIMNDLENLVKSAVNYGETGII